MNAPLKQPLFTYQNGYKDDAITHIHDLQQFDADVLKQNEAKGGIRTVCNEIKNIDGIELDGWAAMPLHDLETKALTGYQLLSTKKKAQPIKVGTGLSAIHLDKEHTTTCVIATDNLNLFLRLDKLNYTAVYHDKVLTAYEAVNNYLVESKPRIIATNREITHDEDLKVHFDADVSQLEDRQIRDLLNAKAVGIEPNTLTQGLKKGHLAKSMQWENGNFYIEENGIFFRELDENNNPTQRFISSPVLVIAKTRDGTSNDWGRLFQWKDDDNVEHTQALSMELFQTDGADLRRVLANQGVRIASSRKARELFSSYLSNYPVNKSALCVDRVGWHDDVFVLPHKQIGQAKNGDLIVYQSHTAIDNRYKDKGDLSHWISQVSQPVENHSLLVFSLCTAFAGQLLDPLKQQGGGFHFKGGSSKGKTTAINLACSVWGNPKDFYRTWRATGNALEHTAYMHNDSFLALDEIGEIANPKEIGNIVYMLANGLGKGRMTKQIAVRPMHQWRLIFLSSGEKSLKEVMQEQGQRAKLGQEIRLIEIDIDQSEYGIFDSIDLADDGAKQADLLKERTADSYGVAGLAWLEYLTKNKAQVLIDAKQLLDQYRKALTESHTQGHIQRVASYFASVAVAGELATQAGITGWQHGRAFEASCTAFNRWLSGFDQVGDYEDREIIAHVKGFFEAHELSRFEACTPDPNHEVKIINRVGYWEVKNDKKIFYVLPEQFKKEICKGYDFKKVIKTLQAFNVLEHDVGKLQKTVRLGARGGNAIKVYAIKEGILLSE